VCFHDGQPDGIQSRKNGTISPLTVWFPGLVLTRVLTIANPGQIILFHLFQVAYSEITTPTTKRKA